MTEDKISLDELFPLQEELDAEIAKLHNVTYESTFDRRLLALLVELSEFANESRCFKYWSLKGPGTKERLLDEYADGLHFFLSLGIPLGVERFTHRYNVHEKDLSRAIVEVYKQVSALHDEYEPRRYASAFGAYLNIIPLFDWSNEEVIGAYKSKLDVNHQRQENKY